MKVPVRWSSAWLIAAGLISGAVGCFGSGAASASANAPAIDRNTLVIGLGKGIDNLDAAVSSTGDSQRFAWMLFESLFRFDRNGTIVPGLATEVKISEDGKTYTFLIRQGVSFHSGEQVVASDVAFSLKRTLAPETKSTRRPYFAEIVESFEAPDNTTFIVRLKSRDGAFLNKIAAFLYVLPEKYITSLASPADFSARPVGTGPYRFVSHAIGQRVDLEAFDGYWDVKPTIKRLIYKVIPDDSSRVYALVTGEVDWIDTVPPAQVKGLEARRDISLKHIPIASPLHVRLYSNDPKSPLADRRVRQAMNYAVDKVGIIKSILQGVGEPMGGYISKYYPYGHDETIRPYPHDPKKARELLKEAGYPNGFKTSIYNYPSMPNGLSESVAAFWGQVGIVTEIKQIDYAAWSRLNNTHKSGPTTLMQFANAMYDPIHPVSGGFGKDGTWSDYNNPEVDELIKEVNDKRAVAERDRLFKKIDRFIHEDAGAVFLSELFYSYAHKSYLKWEPQIGSGYYVFTGAAWKE